MTSRGGPPLTTLVSAVWALTAGAVAWADPWEVRVDPVARAEQLMAALDQAPDSDDGLAALQATAGTRVVALAEARAARRRSWQASFVVGRLRVARACLEHGATQRASFDAAESRFQEALQLGSGRAAPKLLGWIGVELVRAGQSRRAEQLLRRWEPRRRDDAEALGLLARLALERRDVKTALRAQRRTAELRPRSLAVRLVLARLLQSSGELDEAVREFELGVKLAAEGKDAQTECQGLIELGELLELLERFDDAVARYRRGLTLAARGSWAHSELQRRILQSFEKRGALEALVKEAKAMLAEDGKNLLALRTMATQSLRSGRTSDAVDYYKRYVAGAPGDDRARSQLMFLLMRSGRRAEAAAQAGELHRRNPKRLRHAVEYAHLLHSAGQTKKAQQALRDAIAHLGEGEDLQQLVTAFEQLGDSEGARLAWKAMLQRPDPDGENHRAYGTQLWKRGRRTEALAAWSALPGSPPTRLGYERWAEVLLGEGVATSEAAVKKAVREECQRGLKRFPRHPGLMSLAARLGR